MVQLPLWDSLLSTSFFNHRTLLCSSMIFYKTLFWRDRKHFSTSPKDSKCQVFHWTLKIPGENPGMLDLMSDDSHNRWILVSAIVMRIAIVDLRSFETCRQDNYWKHFSSSTFSPLQLAITLKHGIRHYQCYLIEVERITTKFHWYMMKLGGCLTWSISLFLLYF